MGESAGEDAGRLDKWLWHARFFRTRSLATRAVAAGLRVNGQRVSKPATRIRPGDVLTFAQGGTVRVVEVVALALRRAGASQAVALYRDHATAQGGAEPSHGLEAAPAPPYNPSR